MVKIDTPMPRSCGECFAFDREYCYCILFSNGIPARHDLWPYEKPDWCELKEAEDAPMQCIEKDGAELPKSAE